ncbi:UvrD-helicase domain-containing protein [Brachybacterium tyrofermentans]|uniref:UvrD-helicase domain-containing protein n=1 Tax=Brachybacterium tyrofermentans TaxID=47848 RepID=UPI003FD09D04
MGGARLGHREAILGKLNCEQQVIATHSGNFLAIACPGSGKTRTVAARAALRSHEGLNLALISYTNVGAEEILSAASDTFGTPLREGQFSGTIHKFLARYVLGPFGHREMDCLGSALVSEGAKGTSFVFDGVLYNSNDFRVRHDGTVTAKDWRAGKSYRLGQPRFLLDIRGHVAQAKIAQARRGVLSPDDAIMWSAVVILKNPQIARVVAARFDEIVVDEAQDTTDWQVICLRELRRAGLHSLVLVGDFDQSIFSFAGASPEYSWNEARTMGLSCLKLRNNWRSSRAISAVGSKLKNSEPDISVGKHADVNIQPSVVPYGPGALPGIADKFVEDLIRSGFSPEKSGVVARKNDIVSLASGGGFTVPASLGVARHFLELTLARHQGLRASTVKAAEGFIAGALKSASETEGVNLDLSAAEYRAIALDIIARLPGDGSVDGWLDELVKHIENLPMIYGSNATLGFDRPFVKGDFGRSLLGAIRYSGQGGDVLGQSSSMHGAKGRSLDGILIIAEDTKEANSWGSFFSSTAPGGMISVEDARLLYVAITRARGFLRVALPVNTPPHTLQAFSGAGFAVEPG